MLCTNCGADVGNTPRLCDACQENVPEQFDTPEPAEELVESPSPETQEADAGDGAGPILNDHEEAGETTYEEASAASSSIKLVVSSVILYLVLLVVFLVAVPNFSTFQSALLALILSGLSCSIGTILLFNHEQLKSERRSFLAVSFSASLVGLLLFVATVFFGKTPIPKAVPPSPLPSETQSRDFEF